MAYRLASLSQLGSGIRRAHQRLAHEEHMRAKRLRSPDLFQIVKAALANYDDARGHEREKALGRLQLDLEGLEIAVVDPDEPRVGRANGDRSRRDEAGILTRLDWISSRT